MRIRAKILYSILASTPLFMAACGGGGSSSGDGDTTAGDGDTTAGDGDTTAGDGDTTAGDGDTTGDGDGTGGTAGDGDGTGGVDQGGASGDGDGTGGGNITCEPGFTGDDCLTNIDDCVVDACDNGGVCVDEVEGFSCDCATGYEGDDCSTNTDDCAVDSCANGGACVDGVDGFSCDCAVGYDGEDCSNDVDECAGVDCQNGGSCTDLVNDYDCNCPSGFTGKDCDNNPDDCDPNPCLNGACTDGVNDFTCACDAGYEGKDCSTDTDDCAAGPCENGGICDDLVDGYACDCSTAAGYEGDNCEVDTDDCAGDPCENGGICDDLVDGYTCDCSTAVGYEGDNCEVDTDDCAGDPCQNGGTCTDGVDSYSCACLNGFSGDDCENIFSTCLQVLKANPSAASGVYQLDLDGAGASAPQAAYCDMVSDGGGWTLILSSNLSGAGPHGYFTGAVTSGTPAPGSDTKIAATAAIFGAMKVSELRVKVEGKARSMVFPGLTNLAAFGTDNTGCNTAGVSLGNNTYWHPGRQFPCYGSSHFGISTATAGDVHATTSGFHYGHFHRAGVDTGVYWFGGTGGGDNTTANPNNVNEVEWAERYSFWVREGATSCLDLLQRGNTTSGVYSIDPDGPGVAAPFDAYCDMTTDGGGWTLCGRVDETVSGNVCVNEGSAYIGAASITNASYCRHFYQNVGADGLMVHNRTVGDANNGFDDRVVIDWSADPIVAVGNYTNAESVSCSHINGGDAVVTALPNCQYASHGGDPWQKAQWSFTANNMANGYSGNGQNRVLLGPTFDCSGTGASGVWYNFGAGTNTNNAANGWVGQTNVGDLYLR